MAKATDNIVIDNAAGIKNFIKFAISGLVLLLLLLSTIRIINAGEVGILLEFGKLRSVMYPGIHFTIPFMHDVKYLSTQIHKYETPASSASKDLQIVQASVAVNYKISDNEEPIQGIWQNFRGDHENRIIQPLVQEAVKATTAKFTAEELITHRTEVKNLISEKLKSELLKYGLIVTEVSITNFDFSPEFNGAIEAKVVAEQTKLRSQIELEQKQIDVQKTIAEASAAANSTLIKAEAEAAAIRRVTEALNEAYQSEGYLKYKYIEKWNGQLPKIVAPDNILVGIDDDLTN